MNQTATTLLERAWQLMGFEYLSDLRFLSGEERRILSQCFREIEPESYTTFQWNDALAYLVNGNPEDTPAAARAKLIMLLAGTE